MLLTEYEDEYFKAFDDLVKVPDNCPPKEIVVLNRYSNGLSRTRLTTTSAFLSDGTSGSKAELLAAPDHGESLLPAAMKEARREGVITVFPPDGGSITLDATNLTGYTCGLSAALTIKLLTGRAPDPHHPIVIAGCGPIGLGVMKVLHWIYGFKEFWILRRSGKGLTAPHPVIEFARTNKLKIHVGENPRAEIPKTSIVISATTAHEKSETRSVLEFPGVQLFIAFDYGRYLFEGFDGPRFEVYSDYPAQLNDENDFPWHTSRQRLQLNPQPLTYSPMEDHRCIAYLSGFGIADLIVARELINLKTDQSLASLSKSTYNRG